MNKFKAYTIVEMIVTMLITSVTISIAYSSFRIINGQFGQYKSRSHRNYELVLLDKFMMKDFTNSIRVIRNTEGYSCQYLDKSIDYEFEESYILRKSNLTDTFKLKIVEPKFYFMNEEEFVPGALIDKVEFTGIIEEESLSFLYKKEYGADILVEKEIREDQ
ncbi:MAG: prepilin-type N-terminal cleavage/methylation domain-containing protein [Sporocytophaga sp.]|uniref:pilus assembly FimT family protein n=1 Tax=Sporocytophaga sp. TaxID=2231183 RepID=UPI001B1E64DA|nr:prepilin-type N-terminal cleavage/methylation domain-containing protein [Sporocytophaga sp.]MBO9702109.1 prepilin-type N-terminal cleavage/methylation domain-containing protein [Sporocytophaga sp.]